MCPSNASSAIAATVSATAKRFAHVPRPNKLTAANPTATRSTVTLFGVHPLLKTPAMPLSAVRQMQKVCHFRGTQPACFLSFIRGWQNGINGSRQRFLSVVLLLPTFVHQLNCNDLWDNLLGQLQATSA